MAEVALSQLLVSSAIATAVSTGIQVISESGQEDIVNEGPRSDTIPTLDSREGTPQNIVLGGQNRVGGIVIWLPDFVEDESEEVFGGGGISGSGPTVTNTTYQYYSDVAFAVSEGTIVGINKIFANGNLIWQPAGVVDISGTDIQCTDMGVIFFFGGAGRQLLTAPSGGTDLTVARIGQAITIAGFTTGANNGTFIVTNVGTLSDGSTFIRCRNSLAQDEAAGDSVTLDQVSLPFLNSIANSFNQYIGGTSDIDNPVDPIIEAREAELNMVNKTPGYKKTAYGVFQGLNLQPYGNRIPQLTFEVANSTMTVEEAILFLFLRVGVPTTEIDASDLSGITLKGYTLPGPVSLMNALKPILIAYDITVQMRSEKLFFIQRKNASNITIAESELLLQDQGKYQITDVSDSSLPQEVTVTYKDVNNELQQGSQSERRVVNEGEENTLNIDVPLSLTSGEARTIANRELFRLWQRRQRISFMLPPKYLKIQEGDYITLTLDSGDTIPVFITQLNIGNNFVIEVIGDIDHGTPPENLTGEEAVTAKQVITGPVPLSWAIIDHAPLRDGDEKVSGVYFGVARTDPNSNWTGGEAYQSTDDTNFDLAATLVNEGRLGITTNVLGDATPGFWDIINTVNVESSSALTSASELDVLNGTNRAMIGQEIIAFKTATLEADGTYTLSNLLRGLRNTEAFTGTHTATERFVRLTNITLFEIPSSNISTVGYSKVISGGGDLDDVESLQHTFIGGNLTPFSPAHLTAEKLASGDISYTWTRRTRKFHRLFSQIEPGFVDSIGRTYTLRIFDGSTLVRTKVVNIESWIYLSADQTSDGFVATDTITLKLYQQGDLVNGRVSEVDITI